MAKRIAGLTSSIVVALGIAAFAGSALAGNGHGNGNGANNDASSTPTASATDSASQQSHGNSANAPGHVKKGSRPECLARGLDAGRCGRELQHRAVRREAHELDSQGEPQHVVLDRRRHRLQRHLHVVRLERRDVADGCPQ